MLGQAVCFDCGNVAAPDEFPELPKIGRHTVKGKTGWQAEVILGGEFGALRFRCPLCVGRNFKACQRAAEKQRAIGVVQTTKKKGEKDGAEEPED